MVKNIHNRILILAVVIMTTSLSCQKVLFEDEVLSREIRVNDFKAVNIHGIFRILLVQDTVNFIRITGTNDPYSTSTDLRSDTLFITGGKIFTLNHSKNTLELHFRNIEFLVTWDPVELNTAGTIITDRFSYDALGEISEVKIDIVCQNFVLTNSANTLGNFYISGRAESSTFFNRYGSNMFAENLECMYSEITTESVGQVRINARERIVAYLWGPGNIFYLGNPQIKIAEKTGSGNVIRFIK